VIALPRANLGENQLRDERYYVAIEAVRDLGELNRLILLVPDGGKYLEVISNDYRWNSLKGYMYQAEDILAFAEVLGLVSISGGKVRLTTFGMKFRGLNPGAQYELTDDQRKELCRFVFKSPTPLASVAETILLHFRYNPKSGRYEYSIPDHGHPPGRKELYFFLETLKVLGNQDDGIVFIDPIFTRDVAEKIRRSRQLTDEEEELSPDLLDLSRHAEELCFGYERDRLRAAGRPDLADKVEWVAEYDSTVGYDILSYEGGKSKVGVPDRFVEVKSTPTDRFHFFLSGPELRKAREYREKYQLYHLRNVKLDSAIGSCDLQQIKDPATRILDPELFEINADPLHVTCLRKDLGPPA